MNIVFGVVPQLLRFIPFATLILCICAGAQSVAQTLHTEGTVKNYGHITAGEKLNHIFAFRNTGSLPLEILNITSS